MTTVKHGFDLAAVRTALDAEDWETDEALGGDQVRRLYLGSVFSLTPSGKYYLPFAGSNVMGCNTCKGTGRVMPRALKRRTIKKQASRHARTMRRFDRLNSDPSGLPSLLPEYRPATCNRAAYAFIDRQPKAYRYRGFLPGSSCTACNGEGSREAYLDQLWRKDAESAFEGMGLTLENGDGDPCDMYVVEYRDAPDDDEDGETETEEHAHA